VVTFTALFAALAGSLIGSFGNVVVYRLPRGESIVFPGSRCPNCGRHLGVLDLVPVLSYLALGGRCRTCKAPISPRYPLVELLMAVLFAALALRFPPLEHGAAVLPLLAVIAMLVMAALIDIERYILPDALTLPALGIALAGSFLWRDAADLPGPAQALIGALVGAGILVLINRIGALVLRRLADTAERLWPISLDQVNLAAVAGAAGGLMAGLVAGAVSVVVNLVTRTTVRLPEQLAYGLWAVALVLSTTSFTVGTVDAISGSVMAAGAFALLGALYWWLADGMGTKKAETRADAATTATSTDARPNGDSRPSGAGTAEVAADDEPVAMGFGDVKLAAVLGAFLGWERLLVGIFLAVTLGAIGGIVGRIAGGTRMIPFGPYLLLGALCALFFGGAIIDWYLGLLGAA